MAYSVEDDIYIALYGGWKEAADDATFESWATERVREIEHLSSGIQLADDWGVTAARDHNTKTVWFRVALPAAT